MWDISALFLKSPWRWPELWGMNLEQIRNPHLIYPGQVLFLDKVDGRARLRVGTEVEPARATTTRLSPRVRASELGSALSSIPLNLIEPFLNEAVIFETDELQTAPRIVATQEGSVLLSRGDLAYVRGDLGPQREYRIFREPRPLHDPTTGELLGFEASFVGTAEYTRPAETRNLADGKAADRSGHPAWSPACARRPASAIACRRCRRASSRTTRRTRRPATAVGADRVDLWRGLSAGQNQIVALNRGAVDGVERGHVLALWRDGSAVVDPTDPTRPMMQAARRARRHAVRLPRLRAHVVRADHVGRRTRSGAATASRQP